MEPLQGTNTSGYGFFWVANSMLATMMGQNNRVLQTEASQKNQEFQIELENARNLAQDELEAEKIAFKRRMMKLSRLYRQKESYRSFEQQLQTIELQSYIERYWPLAPALPHILLTEIENNRYSDNPLPLNVVLLHAPLLPTRRALAGEVANVKDLSYYRQMEHQIEYSLMRVPDVKLWRDGCVNTDFVGGNANMMNIHFLMGSLPTLVISPKYREGRLTFNAAVWEAQTCRPLMRPLFSISHEPLLADKDEYYLNESIEKIRTALTLIIGATRDSYAMLTLGKEPVLNYLLDDNQKLIIRRDEAMTDFVKGEYQNIVEALNIDKTPKLIDTYAEKDVLHMRTLAHNISQTF